MKRSISIRDAAIIARVLMRIAQQEERATAYGRHKDACALARLLGKLEYLHFERYSNGEIGGVK